jgi:DNA-binding response OmpR family regulator
MQDELQIRFLTSETFEADEQRTRVLIIDQDPALVTLLTIYLERRGFAVRSASDLDRALLIVQCEKMHVIITEFGEARSDSVAAAASLGRLAQAASTPPIVLITTAIQSVEHIDRAAWGVAAMLLKPFRLAELLAAVQAALAVPRLAVPTSVPPLSMPSGVRHPGPNLA